MVLEMFRSIILLFFIPSLVLSKTKNGPIVCLRSNANVCFEGAWMETSKNNQYASFQGIRYAQPPVGELRLVTVPLGDGLEKKKCCTMKCKTNNFL